MSGRLGIRPEHTSGDEFRGNGLRMPSRWRCALWAGPLTLSMAMSAQASFVVTGGSTQSLPIGGNDFNSDLSAQGFDQLTHGAQLQVAEDGVIEFSYIGAESAYTNTFASGSNSMTEHDEAFNFSGYQSFSIAVSAGDIVDFSFTSDSARALTPIDNLAGSNLSGLGIFWDSSQSGALRQIVLGYDDQKNNPDQDFDDMLVRAEFSSTTPVPLPAALPLFGAGLLALGGLARRRRR